MTHPEIKIRPAHIDDLAEMQKLFVDTITEICKVDYDHEQLEAWASGIKNVQRWRDALTTQFALVAYIPGRITGFCTLANGGYIDLLYIHKDYQRQGVAELLYTRIENEAKRLGETQLTADVSKTASAFFEKMAFTVQKGQIVYVDGVALVNYKMTKQLQ